MVKNCVKCHQEFDPTYSGIRICNDCKTVKSKIKQIKCSKCKQLFTITAPNNRKCDSCKSKACKMCGKTYIDYIGSYSKCEPCNLENRLSAEKPIFRIGECKICGKMFLNRRRKLASSCGRVCHKELTGEDVPFSSLKITIHRYDPESIISMMYILIQFYERMAKKNFITSDIKDILVDMIDVYDLYYDESPFNLLSTQEYVEKMWRSIKKDYKLLMSFKKMQEYIVEGNVGILEKYEKHKSR